MTEIRFYHLQKQTLDQALPLILEKAYASHQHIMVKLSNSNEVERMNAHLWAYHPDKFLPHGSQKSGHASQQPIWLTDQDENPNDAKILILTQNKTEENLDAYNLCCEMLNGHDDQAIAAARTRWKEYTAAGHTVTYWHQSESGKWEKKA